MAKTVSEIRQITLLDDTEVTLRPASINVLRKIMKKIGEMDKIDPKTEDMEGDIMNILVEASAIALKKQLPDVASFVDLNPDKNKEAKAEYDKLREEYEEMVDMDIVSLVNEICGGIKFDNPNPLAPATEGAGTN